MIDQLCALGLRRLGLNGGEPLLREDIGKIIDYAKDKGLVVTSFTNGWLVPKRIRDIKNLDVLIISLDGPAEVHDRQREKGSCDKVMEAIVAAKEAGLEVMTNTVITNDNLDCIDFVINKAREMGFSTTYQPVLHYPHASDPKRIKKISPLQRRYEEVIDRLIKEKRAGGPVSHSVPYLEYIKKPDWSINKRQCWAGRLYCAVTPGGDVAPCYPIFRSRKWPNGLELGFKEALNSLPSFTCDGCYCMLVEYDFFFSLKPEVVFNIYKHLA